MILLGPLLLLVSSGVLCKDPIGQNLIIVLVDGLGASFLNDTKPELTYGFKAISDNGVQVEHVRSSFPTHSWPNWISLVTGLHTNAHGFTADYMWDANSNIGFGRGYGANDTEDVWWSELPAPIWHTVGKKGVVVHCYWFAHCHRPYGDAVVQVPMKRWTDLSNPDQTDSMGDEFDSIVSKIKKYQAYRQQMFLVRFALLDDAIRNYGASSDEADEAISRLDLHLNDLQQKLEENELFTSTNLVVLSDHGLAPIDEENQYHLEECLADYSKVKRIVNSHAMLMVFTEPEDEDNIFFELKVCDQWAPMGDYEDTDTPLVSVYRIADVPEHLNWRGSRFMSGIVLITKPGVTIITRELPSLPSANDISEELKSTSGWDPETPEMRGVFMARGPAFKANERFGPLEIVDLYQVFLNILGVEPPHPHNGTWSSVEDMLTEGWEERPNSEHMNSSSLLSALSTTIVLIFTLFVL